MPSERSMNESVVEITNTALVGGKGVGEEGAHVQLMYASSYLVQAVT